MMYFALWRMRRSFSAVLHSINRSTLHKASHTTVCTRPVQALSFPPKAASSSAAFVAGGHHAARAHDRGKRGGDSSPSSLPPSLLPYLLSYHRRKSVAYAAVSLQPAHQDFNKLLALSSAHFPPVFPPVLALVHPLMSRLPSVRTLPMRRTPSSNNLLTSSSSGIQTWKLFFSAPQRASH